MVADGRPAWLLGDPEASYVHAQRMLDHARLGGSGFDVATALTFMAWCLVEGPCPVQEAIALHDALARAAARQRAAELTVVACRAVLMAMLGRYDEARSQVAESSAGLAELQLRGIALYISLSESVAEMLAGDPAGPRTSCAAPRRVRWSPATGGTRRSSTWS